jgi:hypothetical protein
MAEITAAAVMASTCQGMKNDSRMPPRTARPNRAARPTPSP